MKWIPGIIFILVLALIIGSAQIERDILYKRVATAEERLEIVEANVNLILDEGYTEYSDVDIEKLTKAKNRLARIHEKKNMNVKGQK